MKTSQILAVLGAFIALLTSYVVLAVNQIDTGDFALFVSSAVLPTLTGLFAWQNAGKAKQAAEKAVENTNGINSRIMSALEEAGVKEVPSEDTNPNTDDILGGA